MIVDILEFFITLQKVKLKSFRDDLSTLSPWERGEMRRILTAMLAALDDWDKWHPSK